MAQARRRGAGAHPQADEVEDDRVGVLREELVFCDRARVRAVVGRVARRPLERRRFLGGG